MIARFVCAFFVLLLVPVSALAQKAHDPAEFILQKVVSLAKENDELKKNTLTFQRVYVVENLNDKEEVSDKEKEEVVAVELGGKERLVEKNGRRVKANAKHSTPRFNMLVALEALMKFHDLKIDEIKMVENRPYYLISFKPKNGGPKARNDIEEVLIRSEGWMYVDIEKFYIRQLTARMFRSYSRAMGIFNLKRANMEMAQEEFEGVVVMKFIHLVDRYSIFGVDTFEKQTYSYLNYKKGQ